MAKNNQQLLERIENTPENGTGPSLYQRLEAQKSEIERALPNGMDADKFTRIALTTMKTSDALSGATPDSFIACLMLCAQLGFEPGPLGYVYFVPRNVKVKRNGQERWEEQATFQLGYQGWIDLARRTKEIQRVDVRAVFPGDEFSYEYGSNQHLRHVPKGEPVGMLGVTTHYQGKGQNKTRSTVLRDANAVEPTHVYAFVKLSNGEDVFHVMSYQDALAYKQFAKTKGVWDQHPLPMALKTVFLRLKTWLPRSIEMDNAARHDDTTPTVIDAHMLEQQRPADPELAEVEEPQAIEATAEQVDVGKTYLAAMRERLSPERSQQLVEWLAGNDFPESTDAMTVEQIGATAEWLRSLPEEEPLPEEP